MHFSNLVQNGSNQAAYHQFNKANNQSVGRDTGIYDAISMEQSRSFSMLSLAVILK